MTDRRGSFRWIRLLAIALGALVLASCRAISTPLMVGGASVTALPATDDAVAAAPEAASAASWEDRVAPRVTKAAGSPTDPHVITRTGLEAPCPPLPRLLPLGRHARSCPTGRCPTGHCGAAAAGCEGWACSVCPPPAPTPVVGPYLVCDGGDHCAPAKPVGRHGLANLTAGDTVARYRAADPGPDADEVYLVESNCACVFAPRFSSVREVIRPFEDAAPQGPRGVALDMLAGEEIERQPVWGSTQNLAPEAARKALPGVAIEERFGPLAVDQGEMPHEDDGREAPYEQVTDDAVEAARQTQLPRAIVGFDVPIAWTCIRAANVTVGTQAAEVVAADRGTATLRFEEPGRAELTLCKRAGSDTARPGEELDFTIFLLNSGDRPLTDVVLVDALPTRLRLVAGSPASSLPADITTETADDGAEVVKWRLTETLPPGGSGFVRFRSIVR